MKILIRLAKKCRDLITMCKLFFCVVIFKVFNHKKTCLMFSNGMGYGGAPLVLVEAAKYYKNKGYKVIIYSEHYGKLINICHKLNISVWINPHKNEMINNMILDCKYEIVFVNTAPMYKWVEAFETKKQKIIWWLHEGDTYINQLADSLPKDVNDNVKVLVVSPRTIEALAKNKIQYSTDMLFYGVEDLVSEGYNVQSVYKDKTTFLIMGAICERKNQIEVIAAYDKLSDDVKGKSDFIFVGEPLDENDEYFTSFLSMVEERKQLKYIPKVERAKINDLYNEIDSLICSSKDDPLPVVVTECFMFGKIAVVSSEAGQFALIEDDINGFVYNVNDIDCLCKKITAVVQKKDCNKMKELSRKTYERYFMKKSFFEELERFTNEILRR